MAIQHVLAQIQAATVETVADPAQEIRCLADIPRFHAKYRPTKRAASFEGRTTTYADLDERSSRIARALCAEGLQRGDRVVYLGKNSDEYFELLFGCAKAGVVLVPVSWRLAPAEITYIVRDSQAQLLFVGPELADFVSPVGTIRRIISMGQGTNDWLNFAEWYARWPAEDLMLAIEPAAPALQLYTSGTTGHPKGAQLTHANLIATVFGSANGSWDPWQPEDVSLVAMPVAHISGTGWGCLGYGFGALNVIMPDFDAGKALEHIECDHITRMFAVPAAIERMLRVPHVREMDFLLFNCMVYAGSPISMAVLREAIEVFQSDFCQLYGMTETTGAITYLPPQDHDVGGNARMRSAGKPFDHVELRIRRRDGSIAGPNESGEIETRSVRNMPGYWRLPQASNDIFTEDGWLKTGDAGYLDDNGYLYIQDRVTDMIVSGGENIYPAEVEAAISWLPWRR
jgi:long-chain acyl-CoA synthetase